jgi:hypothetical protein
MSACTSGPAERLDDEAWGRGVPEDAVWKVETDIFFCSCDVEVPADAVWKVGTDMIFCSRDCPAGLR